MFWCSSFAFAACIFMLYKHNITSGGNCYFSPLACKLRHFTLRFVVFYLAFCCILPCVLPCFALRLAALCTAFCCILPYFLLQNRNCFCIVCVFIQYLNGLHTVVCSAHFYLNNPLQYSIFCGRVAGWMILMPLFVLNFVLKR